MGSLGDGIMLWPVWRAIVAQGNELQLIGQGEKVKLAAAEIPRTLGRKRAQVVGRMMYGEIDSHHFQCLWQPDLEAEAEPQVDMVILCFDAPVFAANCRLRYTSAEVLVHSALGAQPESELWQRFGVMQFGSAVSAEPAGDRVVVHLGAGSPRKRWPMGCAAEFALQLAMDVSTAHLRIVPVYGEVEAECFSAQDRALLAELLAMPNCEYSGSERPVRSLAELAEIVGGARVFVGCDTGPTHLAAQLGAATLGLYVDSQLRCWHPVGPDVRVLTAPSMQDHAPAGVIAAMRSMMR